MCHHFSDSARALRRLSDNALSSHAAVQHKAASRSKERRSDPSAGAEATGREGQRFACLYVSLGQSHSPTIGIVRSCSGFRHASRRVGG